MPLAAQQAPEVLTLPLFRLLVIQKTALLTTKFWGMDRPASVQVLTRDELVQHLMEDDVFDDVAGHEGLVQETMDADQPITLLIGPKRMDLRLRCGGRRLQVMCACTRLMK